MLVYKKSTSNVNLKWIKSKKVGKKYHKNTNQMNIGVIIEISENVDFKAKIIKINFKRHILMIKS